MHSRHSPHPVVSLLIKNYAIYTTATFRNCGLYFKWDQFSASDDEDDNSVEDDAQEVSVLKIYNRRFFFNFYSYTRNVFLQNDVIYMPQVKKEIHNSKVSTSPETYENVDLDHVYIQFNQEFNSWSEGERVVNLVSWTLYKTIIISESNEKTC